MRVYSIIKLELCLIASHKIMIGKFCIFGKLYSLNGIALFTIICPHPSKSSNFLLTPQVSFSKPIHHKTNKWKKVPRPTLKPEATKSTS